MQRTLLILAVCVLVLSVLTEAQVPQKISYQGLLTTSLGTPVSDGSYSIKFDIFNLPSAGTLRHTETHPTVGVTRGAFSVLLGPLPAIFSESLYVEVTALSGPGILVPTTFSPRSELASAPYALAPWTTSGGNLYYSAGSVAIGTPSPSAKLHVRGNADVTQLIVQANSTQSNTNPLIRLQNSSGVDLLSIHSDDGQNVFVGLNAGRVNSAPFGGTGSTFIGSSAGYANTTGGNNTATGVLALLSNNQGSRNTAGGGVALRSNTTGNYNTANGYGALYTNVAGNGATALGYGAMYYANSTSSSFDNYNVAVGYEALKGSTNASANTGNANTATGYQALLSNTTGSNNTASGRHVLYGNTTGSANTAAGYSALLNNVAGSGATALGYGAMYYANNTSTPFASYDVAVGYEALRGSSTPSANTGNFNTAVGYQALYSDADGGYNTATGDRTLYSNTSGWYNTASGQGALYSNTSGYSNTAIGWRALFSNTTGSYNTALGDQTGVSTGGLTNATVIGGGAIANASNKVRIGDGTVTVIEGQVAYTFPSDGRFKYNITEGDVKGLEFIKRLRPIEYNYDTRKFQEFLTKNMPDSTKRRYVDGKDFSASSSIRQSGFVAQEVEQAMKESGYDFNGLHKPADENDNYGLAYSLFTVPLVKAVQEQQKMIQDQQKMIGELKETMQQQDQRIKELENK